MSKESEIVRRKLLGLVQCPKCKKDVKKDKLSNFSVVTIGDTVIMCEYCITSALLYKNITGLPPVEE